MSEKDKVNLIDKSKWEIRYLNELREIENERKRIITGWIYCEEAVEGGGIYSGKKRRFSLCYHYLSIFKQDNGLFYSIYFQFN